MQRPVQMAVQTGVCTQRTGFGTILKINHHARIAVCAAESCAWQAIGLVVAVGHEHEGHHRLLLHYPLTIGRAGLLLVPMNRRS